MKLLFFILALSASQALFSQTSDMIVTTAGIGPIRIGMSRAAVEKLLGTKLKFPKASKDPNGYDWDTIRCKFKEMDMDLVFGKTYFGNDTTAKFGVYQVSSNSSLIKTKSGIAIGDDKLKIFKIYDQYRLEYFPDMDKKLNPKKVQVNLFDNETSNVLIFYLNDGIVTGFGAMIYEGD